MELKIFFFVLLMVDGWAEPIIQEANVRSPFNLPKGYGPWIRPYSRPDLASVSVATIE